MCQLKPRLNLSGSEGKHMMAGDSCTASSSLPAAVAARMLLTVRCSLHVSIHRRHIRGRSQCCAAVRQAESSVPSPQAWLRGQQAVDVQVMRTNI